MAFKVLHVRERPHVQVAWPRGWGNNKQTTIGIVSNPPLKGSSYGGASIGEIEERAGGVRALVCELGVRARCAGLMGCRTGAHTERPQKASTPASLVCPMLVSVCLHGYFYFYFCFVVHLSLCRHDAVFMLVCCFATSLYISFSTPTVIALFATESA